MWLGARYSGFVTRGLENREHNKYGMGTKRVKSEYVLMRQAASRRLPFFLLISGNFNIIKPFSFKKRVPVCMKKIFVAISSFLASIHLTIILLSAATLIFILQIAREKLALSFPSWKWLAAIGQFDFYHSRGFFVLFALFCINLIGCTLKRLPRTIDVLKSSSKELDEDLRISLPICETVAVSDYQAARQTLLAMVAGYFKKTGIIREDGDSLHLFAEKGRYSHAGFYLAHLCLLLLALGTTLSATGFQYSFEVTKNQLLDPLVVRAAGRQEKALDFSLLCSDLKTTSYGESSKLKKHQSTLSIIKNGATVATQEVDFATPLHYNGIDIYQDRFSKTIPYAKIKIIAPDNQQSTHELKLGDSFAAGATGVRIRVTRLRPDGVQLKTLTLPETLGVAQSPVQFRQAPLQGYWFSLMEITQKESTTLKAIYDPGKDLIWYSFILMVAGFSICFFCSHQRMWAHIERTGSGCSVTLAGAATKNLREVSELIMTIKNNMQKE